MYCPFCQTEDTKVTDSRLSSDGAEVRRRRVCTVCKERFTTYERCELAMPRVIKHDGSRESFEEQKLRSGLHRAIEKRPVSTEQVDEVVHRIVKNLRALGEKELPTDQIGELVMNELRALDTVAYVRFASVYRRFADLDAFKREIDRLVDC
jgi:transcriptional repressor NrdR